MANPARIDELKKKFDENPRRYFAPLANEYRKAGDTDQAIAICREFLPQQPGHMSGHIVYGQALFEAQQYDEARTVFDTALTLDPENLIALRQLGDIAHTLGDRTTARSWYQRVLEADPRNADVAALLTALDAEPDVPEPAAETTEVPAVNEVPEPEVSQTSTTLIIEAPTAPSPEAAARQPEVAAPEPAEPPAAFEPAEPPAAPEPAEPPAALDEPSEPLVFLEPAEPAEPDDALLDLDELSLVHEEPVMPRASTSRDSLAALDMEVERSGDDAFESSDSFDSFDADADAVAADATPTDPFATETMAELYVSQGHADDALRVYRQLLAARPGDEALEARIAELEATEASAALPDAEPQEVPEFDATEFDLATPIQAAPAQPPVDAEPVSEAVASGPSIREFLAALATRTPSSSAPVPAPEVASPVVADAMPPVAAAAPEPELEPEPAAVSESTPMPEPAAVAEVLPEMGAPAPPVEVREGGSIDALFGGAGVSLDDQDAATTLANAFGTITAVPSGESSTSIAGAPARRATNELSLDSVFREPGAGGQTPAAGFTFDRFFAGGTPAQGSAAAPTPPAGQDAGTADADIEQFNSWLDGLKKK
ncbi:MAG TPA: tetratricopeptide repeat protein [Gemmatimonadaceae bacterium]|nr:tetratricopeptide repeat protein [Gemmatimonadaceae bacterium]